LPALTDFGPAVIIIIIIKFVLGAHTHTKTLKTQKYGEKTNKNTHTNAVKIYECIKMTALPLAL